MFLYRHPPKPDKEKEKNPPVPDKEKHSPVADKEKEKKPPKPDEEKDKIPLKPDKGRSVIFRDFFVEANQKLTASLNRNVIRCYVHHVFFY